MRSLFSLSFVLVLLTLGCGQAPSASATCSVGNCSGCCDASGACQLGLTNFSCGFAGQACTTCPSGTTCAAGGICAANLVTAPDGGKPDAGFVPVGIGSACAGNTFLCSDSCVDVSTDENNCGLCGKECASGLVCLRGGCQPLPNDCTVAPCPSDYGCNPVSKKCESACYSNSDCVGDAVCVNRSCQCSLGFQTQCGNVCVSVTDSSCLCPEGFESFGKDCVDIDECRRSTTSCPSGSVCSNNIGSFSCACPPGTIGTPGSCEVDQCATDNGGCGPHANCNDYPNQNRYCTCHTGYSYIGNTCVPTCYVGLDECVDSTLACYDSPSGDRCLIPGSKPLGELCTANEQCQKGLGCGVNPTTGYGTCKLNCYNNCSSGWCRDSVCKPTTGETCNPLAQDCESGACYYSSNTRCLSAGNLIEGQLCHYLNDCAPQLVCLSDVPDGGFACHKLCNPNGQPGCSGGRQCAPLENPVYGACPLL